MARAESIARYILQLAASEPEPELVSHLRLQKLLYYAQGWTLASRGTPLFSSPIEAWVHGPVVRDVYPRFANYGNEPIPPHEAKDAEDLTKDDRALVASVWEGYKKFSATALRQMTHQERPWLLARGTLGPDDASRREMPIDTIRDFFTESLRSHTTSTGISPEDIESAHHDFAQGRSFRLPPRNRQAG